jgi:hypothetical protein
MLGNVPIVMIYALGGMLTMTQNAAAREFLIAEAGKPLFSIVRPENPSPAESLAADELASYLRRIAGASFEVSDRLRRPDIVVCGKDSLHALVPGVEPPGVAPDGYWIGCPDRDLLLVVGADEGGVLYAVYDLLERLGCVWAAPAFGFYEGMHEFVPNKPTLRLSLPEDVIEQPVLKYRKLYVEEGHSHTIGNLLQMIEWMPKRRFNTLVIPLDYGGQGRVRWDNWREAITPELQRRGITIEVGGHGYENFLNAEMEGGALFEQHPEWFGMNERRERERSRRRVLCSSNRDAVDYLVESVVRYLESRPEIDIFDFWPPDGCRWCECETCQALGEPSERHAQLVSHVSEAVRRVRPDVKFECIAYSSYVAPPEKTMIDSQILVDFCPINQCFEYQIYDEASDRNAEYVTHLREWRRRFQGDLSIYSYYRKYAWNSLPNILPHYVQNDLRFYRDLGLDGVSSYAEPGDWGTYELNHYVLGALAWNPETDVDALIREIAALRFGDQAELAKEVYAALEQHTRRVSSIPFTERKQPDEYQKAQRLFEHLRTRTAQAKEEAGDDRVKAALGRMELMLEYLLRDIALLEAQAEGANQEERAKQVDELLEFIQRHENDGVFLHQRIRRGELLRRYGVGG